MKTKLIKRVVAFTLASMLVSTVSFSNINIVNAEESLTKRISVHDPSIVKDGDDYYLFGTHLTNAKSLDLRNWDSYTTTVNTDYEDIFKDGVKWASHGSDDYETKGNLWAPDIIYNEAMGKWCMYMSVNGQNYYSSIALATADDINGPYTYEGTVVYSGFTNSEEASETDFSKVTGTNDVADRYLLNDGWNYTYGPNAIDPCVVYDEDGQLWMSYGSWFGGIFLMKLDNETGLRDYSYTYPTERGVGDEYLGLLISGGYGGTGEGSYIVYDEESDYYYLYESYCGLNGTDSFSNYQIRLFRSKDITGPYVDAKGNSSINTGLNPDQTDMGIKLFGNYKFSSLDLVGENEFSSNGYKCGGHNSALIDDDGSRYLIYHTRFNNPNETHEVRVHQQFLNEDGWPVTAVYEYLDSEISKDGYSMDEILGDYEFINHGLEAETTYSTMLTTYNVTLNEDGTISGDYEGTWSQGNGNYYCTMKIDNVTYKGVFFKQLDESEEHNETMTFSLIGDNNESIWGSKVELTDEMLVKYEEKNLEKVIPSQTKVDINLPTEGKNDIKITWKSNNEEVLSSTGKVKRSEENTEVILTATLTKGEVTRTKDFSVIVKGNAIEVGVEPIYKYDFENVEDKLVSNSGSNDGSATLVGNATVIKDETRGNVLEIINEKGALKANYLALPNNTFKSVTEEGYTVSMWVSVDKDDPNYFEHSALFEASMTKENGTPTYPITRISANLFGRINANGAWSDVTSISNPLESNKWEYVTYTVKPDGIVVYVNGDEVGRDNKDISVCFKDNFLALMTDVRVGSGNIWGDMDISNAKFDNITVFNKALSDKEVEGLYNSEVKTEDENDGVIEDSGDKEEDKHESNGGTSSDADKKDESVTSKPNKNGSKLPQTGAMSGIFTLCIGAVVTAVGGVTLKGKR